VVCAFNKFAEAFASASENDKFITKTKASACWGFGGSVFQISLRPLIRAVGCNLTERYGFGVFTNYW
jgi:hypothetical protein